LKSLLFGKPSGSIFGATSKLPGKRNMNWFTAFFSSTIGRKLVMALTGLFLILFLVVHLAGNLQLLHHDEGRAFNIYAQFMTSNPLIKTISIVNYAFIIIHIVWAIILTARNRSARGVQGYAVSNNTSTIASRNMGFLGTIIFIFLVIHLKGFWAEMHWGGIPTKDYDGVATKDLYATVALAYSNIYYVLVYVVSMFFLAFHLYHGFGSAFQTLGLNHVKYNGVIKFVGVAFSIIVPGLFALIPIVMYINQH
jgi:succinate dehydrogenase / fumarate reductase cytochrome b subunit